VTFKLVTFSVVARLWEALVHTFIGGPSTETKNTHMPKWT